MGDNIIRLPIPLIPCLIVDIIVVLSVISLAMSNLCVPLINWIWPSWGRTDVRIVYGNYKTSSPGSHVPSLARSCLVVDQLLFSHLI